MGGLGVAMLAALAVLFVPGFLALRAMGVPRTWAVCTAPVVSMALYSVLVTVYGFVGVPCGTLTVFVLPVAVLAAAACALGVTRHLSGTGDAITLPTLAPGWIALYVLVGLALCRFVFVSMLPGGDALMVARDLPHHINQVRTFLDSTRWTSLGVDLYQSSADAAIDPISPGGGGFYPSTWHAVCTLVALLTGARVAAAINALNAVFAVVCFPLSVLVLLCYVFRSERLELLAGSVVCLASMYFPWRFLGWGPLYPNMAGFALMPSCAWMVMRFVEDGVGRSERLRLGAIFAVSSIGLAFLHPNAVISVCVFVAPYLVLRILGAERGWHVAGRRVPAPLVAAAFAAGACALWFVLFKAPFMQATVTFNWGYHISEAQGLLNLLTAAYLNLVETDPGHPALALVMACGVAWVARNRRHGWLVASYLLGWLPLFVSYCIIPLRQLVSGFWYTDPRRLAAMAAISGIPVATLGLAALMRLAAQAFRLPLEGMGELPRVSAWRSAVAPVSVLALFLVAAFFPGYYLPGVIGDVEEDPEELLKVHTAVEVERETIKKANSDVSEYSRAERDFMWEVLDIVGPDAVVVNQPFDGSVISYGDCGLRTYYRYMVGYESDVETTQSVIIRTSLANVASDEKVRQLVHDLGLEYVVQLGKIKLDKSAFRWNYLPDEWRGINDISTNTPGFELVLERRGMRLYRIVA